MTLLFCVAQPPPSSSSGIPVIPNIDLCDQELITRGSFGEVRAAKLKGATAVVVKTTFARSIDQASIGKELDFLRTLPPHPHVARVLGVCLDLPDGGIGIVMDYCQYGSLAHFIRRLSKVSCGHNTLGTHLLQRAPCEAYTAHFVRFDIYLHTLSQGATSVS